MTQLHQKGLIIPKAFPVFVLVSSTNSTKLNKLIFFVQEFAREKVNQLKQTERTSKLQRKVSAAQKIIPRKKKLRRITSEF